MAINHDSVNNQACRLSHDISVISNFFMMFDYLYELITKISPFTALPRVTLGVNNASFYAITPSAARVKHGVVYMRVVSTIIFKGQNSTILMCSIMKELTFPRFIS